MNNDENSTDAIKSDDPFNPENLRLSQDFAETVGVKKLTTVIKVKKPGKQDFVRVRPEPEFQIPVGLIELQDDREIYMVQPHLASVVSAEMYRAMLFAAITRQGVPFLWPVKLPSSEGRHTDWHKSGMDAADAARSNWVRVQANMSAGAYDVYTASTVIPDPIWPELTFAEMLKIAFKDRIIGDLQHPVLKRLRGE